VSWTNNAGTSLEGKRENQNDIVQNPALTAANSFSNDNSLSQNLAVAIVLLQDWCKFSCCPKPREGSGIPGKASFQAHAGVCLHGCEEIGSLWKWFMSVVQPHLIQ